LTGELQQVQDRLYDKKHTITKMKNVLTFYCKIYKVDVFRDFLMQIN